MDHEDIIRGKVLECYLLGELDEARRAEFEEHYFTCPECAEELVSAAKFIDNARKPLLEMEAGGAGAGEPSGPPGPGRARIETATTPPWWRRWLEATPKPALAGACGVLAAVAVWQSLGPRAGVEVTGSYFVTATRAAGGAPRKIVVRPGQERIALLFNQTDTTVPRFGFVLENSEGKAVREFQADAPRDTNDIQVLLPLVGLSMGIYTLQVRNAATQAELASLPFELAAP